jgi:hypothetical protein
MNKRNWLILLFALVSMLIIYSSIRVKKRGRVIYQKFYQSNIQGVIEEVKSSAGVTYFKLFNNREEYGFIPVTSILNNNNTTFSTIAQPGDKILKKAGSDTLRLVKTKRTYLYTFRPVR